MKIIIIGGGAAGMAAAIEAAHTDEKVEILILERLDRVGKKILATGNGRCIAISMPLLKIIMEKTAVSQPIV